MIEYIFKTWVFIWLQNNYQMIAICAVVIVFMVFIGKNMLGEGTFDRDKRLDPEEKVKIYFAAFCGLITLSTITALLISYVS